MDICRINGSLAKYWRRMGPDLTETLSYQNGPATNSFFITQVRENRKVIT